MPKPNPLTQALRAAQPRAAQPRPSRRRPAPAPAKTSKPPSREGKVLVGGHYAPEVQIALKIIAAQERTTIQALLVEGINAIFAKRGKPEIADMTTE